VTPVKSSRSRYDVFLDFPSYLCLIDSKFYSSCYQSRLFPSFLKDPSNSESKILKTCITCRTRTIQSRNKRKALQPLDPNIPSKRPAIANTRPIEAPLIPPPHVRSETRLESSIHPPESRPPAPLIAPPIPESCPQGPLLIPPIPESRPEAPLLIPPIPESRPEAPIPESRPQAPLLIPLIPESHPLPPPPPPPPVQPVGFLLAD